MKTLKERFNLEDVIMLYDNDPICEKADNKNKEYFSLEYLKFICVYLKNKIHRKDLSTLNIKSVSRDIQVKNKESLRENR